MARLDDYSPSAAALAGARDGSSGGGGLRWRPSLGGRALVAMVVVGGVLAVMAGKLAWLTIAEGEDMRAAARDNIETERRIEAPRGNILDRAGRPLATNRKTYSLQYSRYRRAAADVTTTLARVDDLVDGPLGVTADVVIETRPSWTWHSLAKRLDEATVTPILERPADFPGVRVSEDYRREYLDDPIPTGAVVGYVGRIPAERAGEYDRARYLADAYVGRAGLERQYEALLAGHPGRQRLKRDARGRQLDDPEFEAPARPGDDLILALDAQWQAAAYAALGEHKGSVVIMEVTTGDVAVLATAPTFDPTAPGAKTLAGRPAEWIHRAVQGGYPPGSTFKLVTGSAAMRAGHSPATRITCDGSYNWPGWMRPFHCDLRSGHGALTLPEALKVSCNVSFFELGHDVGAEGLMGEARRWGFGTPTGIDLGGERAGRLAVVADAQPGELINASIGQGSLVATPLQVAVAYAALANGGTLIVPRLAVATRTPGQNTLNPLPIQTHGRVEITAVARRALDEGFYRAANETGGTASRIGFERAWQVCAKTGTAENSRGGVDAWLAAYWPRANPRWVAVAHVEDAPGHGGEVAGPIVRDLIRLIETAPAGTLAMAVGPQ